MPDEATAHRLGAVSWNSVDADSTDVALALAIGRAMFVWALDPMMLTRPADGAILDANPAACRVLGLTVEQIRALGRDGLRDPDDERWTQGLTQRARGGSFVGEVAMRRGDGSTFPAEISSAVFEVQGEEYAVLIFRDVSETRELENRLREAFDEMAKLATVDELTGLLNRRGFMTVGHSLVEEARRQKHPLVILTADVDGLKAVNDTHGHAVGDQMLRDASVTLATTLRGADVVARIGGDEFAVILVGVDAPSGAAHAAERLNDRLRERARRLKRPYTLTASIGIATGRPGARFDLDNLLQAADTAMYATKRTRVNREAL